MNTRILTSGLSILTVIAAVSAGTYAYFTASAVNAADLFSTGTLKINIANPVSTPLFNITGMKPGDVKTGCLVVTNNGDFDEQWQAYLDENSAASNSALGDALIATITLNPTGTICSSADTTGFAVAGPSNHLVYTGSLNSLVGSNNGHLVWNNLASGPFKVGWAGVYGVSVTMAPTAGNSLEGQTYKADLHVDATQTEDSTFVTPAPSPTP